MESLAQRASAFGEEPPLFERLDPLGERDDPEAVRQLDHGAHHAAGPVLLRQPLDEGRSTSMAAVVSVISTTRLDGFIP